MGFFRATTTVKPKDTWSSASTLVYDDEYINKVTRIPSNHEYENKLFVEHFSSKSNSFKTNRYYEPEQTPTEYDKSFESQDQGDEKDKSKPDSDYGTTKRISKRKIFFSLFSRWATDPNPKEQIQEIQEANKEEAIEQSVALKDVLPAISDHNIRASVEMGDTQEEEEEEAQQESKRKSFRDFFRRIRSPKRERLSLAERLFGKVSSSTQYSQEKNLVYDVQETLTQRYMNNDYATLINDLDAVPFDLRVKTSDQQSLHSRISKAVQALTPLRSGIVSLYDSPRMFDDNESEYAISIRFKSTRQLAKCISLKDIDNPYDVAKKLKDFDVGSITSSDIEFAKRSENNFDLKPIKPVFETLTKLFSLKLGLSSSAKEDGTELSNNNRPEEEEGSPFIDDKTTSTLKSAKDQMNANDSDIDETNPELIFASDNSVGIEKEKSLSIFRCQSSRLGTARTLKTSMTVLDTKLTLLDDEKKTVEGKNDFKGDNHDLCLYSGTTRFHCLFDTFEETSRQVCQNPEGLRSLESSSRADQYPPGIDTAQTNPETLNSTKMCQHPIESRSKKRFSLCTTPSQINNSLDDFDLFALQSEELRNSIDEFRSQILANKKFNNSLMNQKNIEDYRSPRTAEAT